MKPYYQDDAVTIYHGDNREILPALGRFDLLLTDPPYGIGISSNPVRQKHIKLDWDESTPDPGIISLLIARADKAIIWGGNYFNLPAHQCFLAWDKMQPEDLSLAMLEQAWTNLNGPAKMFRKCVTSYQKQHPTQKPVELITWCIVQADKKQDVKTILDPFAGSGTTGRAAKDMGRKCVLIEREEKYCEIAANRMLPEVFNFEETGK